MTAPARLRIGAQWWQVRRAKLDGDRQKYGETDERRLRITLAPWVGPGQARDTLLHEVLHAIWSQTALDQDEDEQERIVRSFTPWLLQVLRDNPELVEFLLAAE